MGEMQKPVTCTLDTDACLPEKTLRRRRQHPCLPGVNSWVYSMNPAFFWWATANYVIPVGSSSPGITNRCGLSDGVGGGERVQARGVPQISPTAADDCVLSQGRADFDFVAELMQRRPMSYAKTCSHFGKTLIQRPQFSAGRDECGSQ